MRTVRNGFILLGLLSVLMAAFAALGLANHTQERDDLDQHCPDHQGHPNKVENPAPGSVHSTTVDGTEVFLHFSDDLHSVEFFADEAGTTPLVVEFCIKAADKAGGKEIGHEGHVSWENSGGQTPEISYVVVYRVVEGTPPDECPAALVLSPDDATNQLGETHTVTATVTDSAGNPCDDVTVRFEVAPAAGAVPPSGTATTGANGQASFSYTRDQESSDTITACTTDDGQAPASCDEAGVTIKDTATKTWEEPEGFWTCNARALELLGIVPVEANPDGVRCTTDQDEIVDLLLGEDEELPVVASATLLQATTEDTQDGPFANAIVTGVVITDDQGATLVGAHVMEATATGSCQGGEPTLEGSSSIAQLNLMGDDVGDVNEPTDVDLDAVGLGTVRLNHAEETQTADGAQLTQRAFWWDGFPLGDIVLAEATADYHGDPCQ